MVKRILVGLAGTTYTPAAIQRAVELAQAHGAEVTGVTALDASRLQRAGRGLVKAPNREGIRAALAQIARDQILQAQTDFESACRAANVKHRLVEETADPFTSLVDLARFHDLMVFGLQSAFDYDFFSADPEALLVRLVGAGVRPLIAEAKVFRDIQRVLIAISGSMESAKAMKRFVQMGLWPHAELKLIAFQASDDEARKLLRSAEEYCEAYGYRVQHEHNPGDPQALLLTAATLWQADLIVMGNSARSVLRRRMLGDTLMATLRGAEVPLFLAQ